MLDKVNTGREAVGKEWKKLWEHLAGVSIGLTLMIGYASCNVYCLDDLFQKTVSVDAANLDAKSIVQRLLGVISGIMVLVGLFFVVSGVFKYIEAKSDDNPAQEAKAAKQLGAGVCMCAGVAILNWVF